jgi:thioredoxin 1
MPCKMMAPIVNGIAKKYAGKVIVGKVDVDKNGPLAMKYQTMSIPTFIIFKDGKPVDRALGAVGNRLEELIKVHI